MSSEKVVTLRDYLYSDSPLSEIRLVSPSVMNLHGDRTYKIVSEEIERLRAQLQQSDSAENLIFRYILICQGRESEPRTRWLSQHLGDVVSSN